MQEVLVARNILICCGEYEIPWMVLEQWYKKTRSLLLDFQLEKLTGCAGLLVEQRISLSSTFPAQYRRFSLEQLIEMCVNHGCKDPRDRVYALLGLIDANANARMRGRIIPNYKKSAGEVQQDVLRALSAPKITPYFRLILRKALEIEDLGHPKPGV